MEPNQERRTSKTMKMTVNRDQLWTTSYHTPGEIVDAMELHEPMVRNEVIRIISSQEFETMRTTEGRLKLQEELKDALTAITEQETGSTDIEAVLFTNFFMQ